MTRSLANCATVLGRMPYRSGDRTKRVVVMNNLLGWRFLEETAETLRHAKVLTYTAWTNVCVRTAKGYLPRIFRFLSLDFH